MKITTGRRKRFSNCTTPDSIRPPFGNRCLAIDSVLEIASCFDLGGQPIAFQRFGQGHINDTFAVSVRAEQGHRRFILQRINKDVFTNPEAQIDNVRRVTEHLRSKHAELPAHLALVSTVDGNYFLKDIGGEYWRAYDFVEGSVTFEVAQNPEHAKSAASMFGRFQRMVADLPGERLYETIPDFHNTPARYRDLHNAVRADNEKRAEHCLAEIDQALAWEVEAGTLVAMHKT
ncbi:MAG: phosphotransferase, partial [Woeseiaceae bacterium]